MNDAPFHASAYPTGSRETRIRELRSEIDDILRQAPVEERVALGRLAHPAPVDRVETAARLYAHRRRRQSFFNDYPGIFGEPAWDILLDLYAARRDRKFTTVSSASLGACTPTTTGLRWIAELQRLGLIRSQEHPADRRARVVMLTSAAESAMDAYLEAVEDCGFRPIRK